MPTETNPISEQPQDWMAHPRVQQLIDAGARHGELSYDHINDVLGELQGALPLDEGHIEILLDALERRGIAIVDATEEAPRDAVASPASGVKKSRHADLDEALASLATLFAAGEAPSVDESDEDVLESGDAPVEDALKQYLNQMGRVPLLDAEEELRLARLVRRGAPAEQAAARQKLVESNLRLVVFMARRYAGYATLPLLDIVQEGNIGLMRAVDRFDPERGHRLSTYATWWIRRAITRALAEQSRSIRLPGHLGSVVQKLHRLQRELTQSLGREPSRQELAQAAGMTVVQVVEALRAVVQPLSLEAPLGDSDEDPMELGESLSDPDADTASASFSRRELREEIRRVLQGLSEREQAVVTMRYGLGEHAAAGPRSLEDIAGELNLSRERVRQLEIRALRKLRRRSRSAALGEIFGGSDR